MSNESRLAYGGGVSHPDAFDHDDPMLRRLRELALAFPSAAEKVSHGRPCFYTKKIFAIFGATVKGDHHSGKYGQALVFLPDPDERVALDSDDRFFVPAYWGPHGWRAINLTADGDWEEVEELLEDSFRQTANAKLIAELS